MLKTKLSHFMPSFKMLLTENVSRQHQVPDDPVSLTVTFVSTTI